MKIGTGGVPDKGEITPPPSPSQGTLLPAGPPEARLRRFPPQLYPEGGGDRVMPETYLPFGAAGSGTGTEGEPEDRPSIEE